jgi:uncharacterized spore protein YtfJ
MEKQEVGIDNPVEVAGVTLLPVVKVSLNYWHAKGGISFFGVKQAVAVVVVHPTAKRAFRVTGEEVTLDQLMQEFPSTKETLERL